MFRPYGSATLLRLATVLVHLSHRQRYQEVRMAIMDLSQALAGSAVASNVGESPVNLTGVLSYADNYCSWPFMANDRH